VIIAKIVIRSLARIRWRYERCKQKPQVKEGQTYNYQTKKDRKTNIGRQNFTQIT